MTSIETYIRDSKTFTIPLTWGGSSFTPDVNWKLIFTVKSNLSDPDTSAVIQKITGAGISTSGTNAIVSLVPVDTDGQEAGTLYWGIQAQHLTTGAVQTVGFGRLRLIMDVTRETTESVTIYTTEPPVPITPTGDAIAAADDDTPLDADQLGFWDVVDGALKSLTWNNAKLMMKGYFDTKYIFAAILRILTGALSTNPPPVSAVAASGTIAVTGIIVTSVTVGDTTYGFDASPTAPYPPDSILTFGLTTPEQVAGAIAAILNNRTDVVAVVDGQKVTVYAVVAGTAGNAIALAATGADIAVSGATLTGGTESTVTAAGVGQMLRYGDRPPYQTYIAVEAGAGTTVWSEIPSRDVTEAYTDAHEARSDNPHAVTASQVGLGNVDNTADVDKPISSATQTSLDGKVNAVDIGTLAAQDVDDVTVWNLTVTSGEITYGVAPTDPAVAALSANIATAGGTITTEQKTMVSRAVADLRQSTAWSKIYELWVPVGDNLAASLVKLIYPSGNAASLTGTNLVEGDYVAATGIIGNGTNKCINSDFAPAMDVGAATSQFFGAYSLSNTWSGSLAGTTGGTGTYLRYQIGTSSLGGVSSGGAGADNIGYGLRWVQFTTTTIEAGQAGFRGKSTAATPALPTGSVQLLSSNTTNYCTATIGGYVYAETLTTAEAAAINAFFDAVNRGMGRAIFNPAGINFVGDSIVNGFTVTATERFSHLVASDQSLAEYNDGVDGMTLSDSVVGADTKYTGPADLPTHAINWTTSTKKAATTIIHLGINDALNAVDLAQFVTDYEAALMRLQDDGGYNLSRDLLLCTPLWIPKGESVAYTYNLHRGIADAILSLGAKYKIRVCDLYRGRINGRIDVFQVDAIHPTAAGHALLALDVVDALAY